MAENLAILRENCLRQTKKDLKEALALPDRRISQTVSAISEIEEALCVSAERLKEWFSLYYPEAAGKIKKQEAFVRIVSEKSSRKDFHDIVQDSIGGELSKEDLHNIRSFAKSLSQLYSQKGEMEAYLEKLMKQSFPNLQAIAGNIVGAKLIAHCGDAHRLANLPSSTIQVLGAEKALFRHMKTGANPPKYGILLGHNLLQNARKEGRGKIARALASVISLAVKIDVHSKENQIDFLKKKLDNKLKVIDRRSKKGAHSPVGPGAQKQGKPGPHKFLKKKTGWKK
ncbi:MAG: NOP5/NOP56 family protein [archaeon]